MAIYYDETKFDGDFEVKGGAGVNEHGASGTVYLKRTTAGREHKTLKTYNRFNGAQDQVCLSHNL